jgi:hypothetical protein
MQCALDRRSEIPLPSNHRIVGNTWLEMFTESGVGELYWHQWSEASGPVRFAPAWLHPPLGDTGQNLAVRLAGFVYETGIVNRHFGYAEQFQN